MVRTVIVALPADTPVTTPDELTVATALLLVLQVTDLFVALDGNTVAVSCCVPPTFNDAVVGDTLTPVTGTFTPVFTVTLLIDDVHRVPSLCEVTASPT
jgi:hypothetical protein